jgi:hypothetical protein
MREIAVESFIRMPFTFWLYCMHMVEAIHSNMQRKLKYSRKEKVD